MNYNIRLCNPVTKETLELANTHFMTGVHMLKASLCWKRQFRISEMIQTRITGKQPKGMSNALYSNCLQ